MSSYSNVTSVQDPLGYTSTATFDVLRRLTQTTTTTPFSYVAKFTFDDNGNTTKVERQTSDPANPWQTSQATFTADNKLLTATDPQGNVSTLTYDTMQRLWKTQDAIGRLVTNFFDDADRVISVTDPASITAVTTTFTDNGKVASIKDARNYTTSFSFDGHDRPLRTTYQDATYEEVSSYDGNSNPLVLRTRSAATVTLTYDELNRVKTKTPTGQAVVTTAYDIAGRVTTVSTPVVAGDPSSGTFTKFYDTAGRLYEEQYPDGLSVIHVLDANGNGTKMTYPDGYFIDRVFDELNRLTDIKLNGAGTSALNFQYDALSWRTKLVYENGCTTSYGFEVDNDLSNLLHNFAGSSVAFSYTFDNVNQMLSQRTSDPANFRWIPGAPATVAYGTASNINQYPTVGGASYSYSTDGNLTNDGTFKYEFSTERMMTRVRNAGTNAIIADYLYDPALRQRQKSVGGVKTNFYYAGFQRLADYDGTALTLQNRYIYGTSMDEILVQVSSGGTKTYYHANHQGSVIATTNSSGTILNRYTYGPFGESVTLTGITHGYTGQRYDSETGLYYYKMRYYSPKIGRFLQADPLGLAGGLNLYSYVGNTPLRFTDPMGLISYATTDFNIPGIAIGKRVPNGFYNSTTAASRRADALTLVADELAQAVVNGAGLTAVYKDALIGLPDGTTFTADYLEVTFSGNEVRDATIFKVDVSTRLLSGALVRDPYPGNAASYNVGVLMGYASVIGNPAVSRLSYGHTNVAIYDVTFNEFDVLAPATSSSQSVRYGYAGLGGALQGYTFDVLTKQWVTDYDFYLLAHGGSPSAGGGGSPTAGNGAPPSLGTAGNGSASGGNK